MQSPPQMPQFNGVPGGIPVIGQRPSQQEMQARLTQAVSQMATAIYVQVASAHVASRDEHQFVDREHLQQHAKDAQMAAKAYFEGIGVATFQDAPAKPAEQG